MKLNDWLQFVLYPVCVAIAMWALGRGKQKKEERKLTIETDKLNNEGTAYVIKFYREQVDILISENRLLRDENATLKKQHEITTGRIAQLERDVTNLTITINNLNRQLP